MRRIDTCLESVVLKPRVLNLSRKHVDPGLVELGGCSLAPHLGVQCCEPGPESLLPLALFGRHALRYVDAAVAKHIKQHSTLNALGVNQCLGELLLLDQQFHHF